MRSPLGPGQHKFPRIGPRCPPAETCDRIAEANATALIMEPGWLVLLISLFVQMFFTVLASRRGCD